MNAAKEIKTLEKKLLSLSKKAKSGYESDKVSVALFHLEKLKQQISFINLHS